MKCYDRVCTELYFSICKGVCVKLENNKCQEYLNKRKLRQVKIFKSLYCGSSCFNKENYTINIPQNPLKIGKEHVLLVECSVSNERNGKIPKRPI
jgi:hypothetical protein